MISQLPFQYHILLILADGQITTDDCEASRPTIDAIVEASYLPLSIVMVGIGDGPWDKMKQLDDNLPQRRFDNFQFVNFCEVIQKEDIADPSEEFALRTLMEIPDQFRMIKKLGLLNKPP